MTSRFVVLLSTLLLINTCAIAADTTSLLEVLPDRNDDRQLEVTFVGGWSARGYLVDARADSLYLRDVATPNEITVYAISGIVRVRQWRSNASTGASAGALSGGVIAGGLGLLTGAYLASINDSDASDTPAYVIGTALGAAAGMLAGGTIGLGIGALSSSWHHIWPSDYAIAKAETNPYSENTRVGLFAGAGTTLLTDYQVTRFVGRASVRKNVGGNLSLGPEISYHSFGGNSISTTDGAEIYRHNDNLIKVAFVTNIAKRTPGLTPYATLGVGWFFTNDAYVGGHLGGGLRHQYSGGNDLEFDVRYHFSFSEVDPGEVNRFWTIGLGFGFGL